MDKRLLLMLIVASVTLVLLSFDHEVPKTSKINGVSFVAPRGAIEVDKLIPIKNINANWVAIIPYAFSEAGEPEVRFNYSRQWWGERIEGAAETIKMSKELGLKVMLKPHVWVRGQGWPGDFDLQNEEDWKKWENDYEQYILTYAHLADSMGIELFCIGTEYRKAVVKRPQFWIQLIEKVRKQFKGSITYAANWDNFENIVFWDKLDFIGIDAYFPLSEERTPQVNTLKVSLQKNADQLKTYYQRFKKPILFTEFGYQSVDYATDGHWKYSQDTLQVNLTAQQNAYEALFQSYWQENWFAGGFLWKWHAEHEEVGGEACKRFTPQNKPSEKVISRWFHTTGQL